MRRYRRRPDTLGLVIALVGAAALVALVVNRRGMPQPAGARSGSDRGGRGQGHRAALSNKVAAEAAETDDCEFVRPAGPDAMRDPPRRWEREDEASDESFPASDPPANY